MNLTHSPRLLLAATVLCAFTSNVWALGDQWYFGIGGGVTRLQPNPSPPGLDVDEEIGQAASVFLGVDLDDRTSVQVQLHSLGEAVLDDDETVDYYGADASVLYRFADSRDYSPRGSVFGVSLYGRFGLGYLRRESDVALRGNAPVNFGAGAGVEMYLSRNFALRAEGIYHDSDAASAQLALVARFGGTPVRRLARRPSPPPAPADTPARRPDPTPVTTPATDPVDGSVSASAGATTAAPTLPVPTLPVPTTPAPTLPAPTDAAPGLATRSADGKAAIPADGPRGADASVSPRRLKQATADDRDADDVPNADDVCPRSALGFPVRENGCALFDGVLSGVAFVEGTAELAPESFKQLDYLANLLREYPQSRIELLAHTDNSGTVRDQSILTRARLRTVGTYLVQEQGVRSNRLVLRSFGGTRPLYDNATEEGKRGNNRIEVIEHTS